MSVDHIHVDRFSSIDVNFSIRRHPVLIHKLLDLCFLDHPLGLLGPKFLGHQAY
jgi:hypothetical protein